METKEIKIQVPEGYEIDKANSTFECIKFKPKKLTYEDVAKALFTDKTIYYPNMIGEIEFVEAISEPNYIVTDPGNASSAKQVSKLLALNKLINVAKYLNGDWEPNFTNNEQKKWVIFMNENSLMIDYKRVFNFGTPCFRTKELAEQAIEIFGEETIKLALAQV